MMDPLGKNFADKFKITILDFPGFGSSQEPDYAYNISDYVELLHDLVKELKIENPIIIGHSFGGRVAIFYSSMYPVSKLVLFGSPCMKEKKDLTLSVKILKAIKRLPGMNKLGEFMKKYIGSPDYRMASLIMRQTLVEVVNEDW